MPVVVITRWPWIVIASAPPFHSALATAWMSCWWTTSRLRLRLVELMTSSGASESVIVSPGPERARSPAGSSSPSTRRRSLRTSPLPTREVELLDVAGQVGDPLLQRLVLPVLLRHEARQVGVAARPQVGAAAVGRARREQHPAGERHQRRAESPAAQRRPTRRVPAPDQAPARRGPAPRPPVRPAAARIPLGSGARVGRIAHGDYASPRAPTGAQHRPARPPAREGPPGVPQPADRGAVQVTKPKTKQDLTGVPGARCSRCASSSPCC